MNLDLYNDDFFKWHYDYVHGVSAEVGNHFAAEHKFNSVVDYGCGIGSYLWGIYEQGIKIKGYEISEDARIYTPEVIQPYIEYKDFLTIEPERYDVCLCIEVAEHIDSDKSERLVDVLCESSDYIIFSAAPLGQEGTGHINCQPREFWIKLFKKKGFKLTGTKLKSWERAPDYVIKNLMIYEKL